MTDLDRMIENKITLMNGNGNKHDEDPHEEMRKALPSAMNFAKCDGDNCGHVKMENQRHTDSWKSCPSCKNNVVPKKDDYCFNCGSEDRGDADFWNESDVEMGDDS